MGTRLCEKIAHSRALGQQYKESGNIKIKKGDMDAMKPHLSSAKAGFDRVVELSESLRLIAPAACVDTSSIRKTLSIIKKGLDKDEFKYSEAQILSHSVKQYEEKLNSSWTAYVNENISGPKNLVQPVKDVVCDRIEYKEMIRLENRIKMAKPGSEDALEAIKEYLVQYKALMDKVNLSDSVYEFIMKITAKQSVSLADLEPECLEDLKNHEFAKRMKIIISKD